MSDLKLSHAHIKGFPFIKFEGDLTTSAFAALHLVVKGATKFGTVPVIVDLSGDLSISDEVKEVKCWRSPIEIPDYARRVVLLVISSPERLDEIRALLTPHELQHAQNIEEAIDLINKKAG